MGHIVIGVSVLLGLIIIGYGFRKWSNGTWLAKTMGRLILLYGLYFSFFTGSLSYVTGKVPIVFTGNVPIGISVLAGGAVGWGTSAIIGSIGVVTEDIGIAVGAIRIATLGAILGGIGAIGIGFGAFFLLFTPWFWGPLILIGLFLMFRSGTTKKNQQRIE